MRRKGIAANYRQAAGAANKPARNMINWRPLRGDVTVLRKTIYATLIVILTMGTASAQQHVQGLPGYSNSSRTDQEKKNDKDIDRAYQSTIKGRPDAEKNLIRGPMSVQLHQPPRRTSSNKCEARRTSPSCQSWCAARTSRRGDALAYHPCRSASAARLR